MWGPDVTAEMRTVCRINPVAAVRAQGLGTKLSVTFSNSWPFTAKNFVVVFVAREKYIKSQTIKTIEEEI